MAGDDERYGFTPHGYVEKPLEKMERQERERNAASENERRESEQRAAMWDLKDRIANTPREEPTPLDLNDPAQRAHLRRLMEEYNPEQIEALDQVEAVLAEAGYPVTSELLTQLDTGEKPFFECKIKQCSFESGSYKHPGTLWAALTEQRILVLFRPKYASDRTGFTTYSIPWSHLQSAKMRGGFFGKRSLILSTENGRREKKVYILQGPGDLSDLGEIINTWLTTFRGTLKDLTGSATLPPELRS